jgi:hypothetical protein
MKWVRRRAAWRWKHNLNLRSRTSWILPGRSWKLCSLLTAMETSLGKRTSDWKRPVSSRIVLDLYVVIWRVDALTDAFGHQFCLSFALLTSYFMILSSASIHSAFILLIMMTCVEEYYLVLVLMRAWAIWGTRKRVIQILIMGYVGYVLMLMGASTYGINNKHGSYSAAFSILVIRLNCCTLVVQFPHLVSVEICVGAMPSMLPSFYLFCVLMDHLPKIMWLVRQLYIRWIDRHVIAIIKTLVAISCCKVRIFSSVFIGPAEYLQALFLIH